MRAPLVCFYRPLCSSLKGADVALLFFREIWVLGSRDDPRRQLVSQTRRRGNVFLLPSPPILPSPYSNM